MAFSVSSPLFAAEGRRRRSFDDLEQSGAQASGQVMSALERMQAMAEKKQADELAAADVARKEEQRAIENKREDDRFRFDVNQAHIRNLQTRYEREARERAAVRDELNGQLRMRQDNEEHDATMAAGKTKAAADARARSIESIKVRVAGLLERGNMADEVIADALATADISPDEVRGIIAEVKGARAEAEARRALLEAQAKRAQRPPSAGGRSGGVTKAKDSAPDVRTRTRSRQLDMANGILDEIEKTAEAFEKATAGSTMGRIAGKVRGVATGYVPGMNESERTAYLANAEALNAMLFPILGREDAPTETEVKRLAPLMIGGENTPDELRAKIKALRRMLEIGAGTMPSPQAAPAPAPTPRPRAGGPTYDRPSGGPLAGVPPRGASEKRRDYYARLLDMGIDEMTARAAARQ